MFLILFCLVCTCCSAHQARQSNDGISVSACIISDSIKITVESDCPEYQMSFLMQGLIIYMVDSLKSDTVTISFPNARMVRHKMKRHPNEVKAMLDENQKERRPDLQPLVSALNETSMIILYKYNSNCTLFPNIQLNKDKGSIKFSVKFPNVLNLYTSDIVTIIAKTSQFEQFNLPEFEGIHLSKESKMRPGGLGQNSNTQNDSNRNFIITQTIRIQ